MVFFHSLNFNSSFAWWWRRVKLKTPWWTMLSVEPINHNHRLSSQLKQNLWCKDRILISHNSLSSLFFTREHYFASAAWVSQTEVSVVWMNRAQNLSVVTLCKSPMWYCQEVSGITFKVVYFSPTRRRKIFLFITSVDKWFMFHPQTHKTSGDGRGWVDELSIPYFSANVSSYIAISPVREGNSGEIQAVNF